MALDKSQFITAAARHAVKEIDVPGLGETVYIREISAGERDSLEMMAASIGDNASNAKQYRARCVAMFLSDADGKRLFGNGEIAQLDTMNAKPMDVIFEAGLVFNGLGAAALEESEKN